jgi:hypothetical protein
MVINQPGGLIFSSERAEKRWLHVDPERGDLSGREHRVHMESPFAGRHGLNIDPPEARGF